jgi:hypothetical protein
MIDLAAPTHFELFDPLWYRADYERNVYFLAPVAYVAACGEFLVGITAIFEKVTVMDAGIMSYERSGVSATVRTSGVIIHRLNRLHGFSPGNWLF